MKFTHLIVMAIVSAILFTGCLTTEYKEYKFEFTGKGSGKLTIKYVNVMSKRDNEEITKKEEIDTDYAELLDKYVNGSEIENAYPNAKLVSKRLFEENYKLCGEVVFEFTDISQVNLYQYDKKSPLMYYLSSLSSEEFYQSNGKIGPDNMPVIFWDKGLKSLTLTTKVTEQNEETTSMLDMWKRNK